jgi:hypothetical protein
LPKLGQRAADVLGHFPCWHDGQPPRSLSASRRISYKKHDFPRNAMNGAGTGSRHHCLIKQQIGSKRPVEWRVAAVNPLPLHWSVCPKIVRNGFS